MNFAEAIKAQKAELSKARRKRLDKMSACRADIKAAEKKMREAQEDIEKVRGEGSILAEFSDATLYYDRIEGPEWSIPLTSDIEASLSTGGTIAYGGSLGAASLTGQKGAQYGRVNKKAIFVTITSSEWQATIEKKLGLPEHHAEEEAAAHRFIDAVYNASRHVEELAEERERILASLESTIETAKQEESEARAALEAAKADTVAIEVARERLERLQREAQENGLDALGQTVAQRRRAQRKRIIVAVAIIAIIAIMIAYLVFSNQG